MKKTVQIQFKEKHFINKFGNILSIVLFLVLIYYLVSASFYRLNFSENAIFIFLLLLAFVISGSLAYYRTYETATIDFINEGIIIQAKIGFIPIKYEDITFFKSYGIIDYDENTVEFLIETKNSNTYKIKSHPDIYDSLISVFPDKNGKYLL